MTVWFTFKSKRLKTWLEELVCTHTGEAFCRASFPWAWTGRKGLFLGDLLGARMQRALLGSDIIRSRSSDFPPKHFPHFLWEELAFSLSPRPARETSVCYSTPLSPSLL